MFCLFLNTVMITDLIRTVFGNQSVSNTFRNAIYIFTILYVIFHAYKHGHLISLIILSSIYLLLCLVNLFGNSNEDLIFLTISGSAIFLSRCVAGYYFASYIPINEVFFNKLKKYYILIFIYSFLYLFFNSAGLHTAKGSYMTFSYNILIPTTILLLRTINKPTIFKIVSSIYFTGVIVVLGARGPLMCIAITVLVYMLVRLSQISTFKRVLYCFLFSIFSIMIIAVRENILNLLMRIYPQSRTLTLMKTGEFFALSDRDLLYETIFETLRKNPLIPHGIYSDRIILSKLLGTEGNGAYAHNVIFEVLYQFGIVFGGILLVYLGWLIVRGLIKLKFYNEQDVVIFTCASITGIISLFFSGSYLINERTWLSIGILWAIVYRKSALKKDST